MKATCSVTRVLTLGFFAFCVCASASTVRADECSLGEAFQPATSSIFSRNADDYSFESAAESLAINHNRFSFMPRVPVGDRDGATVGGPPIFSMSEKGAIGKDAARMVAQADRSSTVLRFTDGRLTGGNGVIAAPEPTTLVLLASGLGGFAARSWRKRKSSRN